MQLVISDPIMAEIGKVLRGDTFAWPHAEIEKALRQITRIAQHVTPEREIDVIKADPDDNRILEVAVAGKSDYLVTGDDHLLRLGEFESIPIISVAEFLNMAREAARGR